MENADAIPPEIQAGAEANVLFDALRRGDFTAAAKAQERLNRLGWYLTREQPKSQRRTQKPHGTHQEADGREGDHVS
jgi:hypothetical protein